MAKDDFEDFLSRITFAESRGKRTDSSGKLLEGPMTKYGTAKGELQVLDSTNKKPGYGVVAAKDDTPDERARVGRDYLKAMLDKFKDKRTAAIAYNWGPGNTQKWLDSGADETGLPQETQNYVKKVMGTAVAKAPAPPDMAPAPRQAAGAPSVPNAPANRPVVSRETVGPGAQAEDRLSALGPSYQAAMALSYLADTTNPAPQEEDEDGELRISGDEPRTTAREDDDVTNFLTEPSARTALADFDFKIQSPFAERPVRRMAGGGDAELTQEEIDAASRPSFGNPNIARQAAKTRSLQGARSNDVNTLPDPQTYAFTQGMLGEAPDQMGFSPTHPDYKKIIGRGEQGMVTGGVSMIGPAAKALKGLVGMGAKTLKPAASAAEISKDFLQRQKAVSSGPDGAARMAIAQRNAALPIEQGGLGLPANNTAMDRAAAMGFDTDVFHGTSKDFLTFNPDKEVFAAELPEIANLYGKYRKGDGQRIMPLKIRGKQLTISDMNKDGNTSQFGYNLAKKLNLSDDEIEKLLMPRARYPNGELIPDVEHLSTTFSDLGEREIINRLPKHGIDRLKVTDMYDMGGQQTQYMLPAGSDNVRSSFAAYDPFRRTAAVAAAMGAAAPDLLAGQEVNRAKGSPEEGEIKFKKDKEPSFDEKISEGMISGEVGDEGKFIRNSKTVSSKQLAELLKESNASLPASSVTSNAPPPRYINYDLNVGGWTYGFGPLKGQIVISGDKDTPQDPKDAMNNVNTQAHEAYHQRAAADKHSLLGKDKITNDPDWLARRRLQEIMEEFQPDSKKSKGSAPNSLASSYWGLNPNKSQEEQIANLAGYEGMHPKGTSFVDTEVGKKILKKYPSLIDYYFTQSSVPYGGIWEGQSKEPGIMDNAARMFKKLLLQKGFNTVNRAKGSPEEGEVSQEEIDAASKPSFRAQSSGMNRQRGPISDALASGEAYTAAAKGLTNLPYNIAGAPMDLAMLARQGLTGQAPAGQVGTSEYIKNKMTEFGIRQAPPTDPTLKGFYELGDLGSNLVNPAAPVRGAVKVAEKTGEAAKMLAKDFQQYNRQLEAPGASYAVRAKGTPVVMSPVPYVSPDIMTDNFLLSMDKAKNDAFFAKNPDLASWEYKGIRNTPEFKDFSTAYYAPRDEVTDLLDGHITQSLARNITGLPTWSVDPALGNWFSKTFSRYLRSDFASPSDQLVRAADEGKLLHLAPKELWFDDAANRELAKYLGSKQSDLRNTREAEGFPRHGMAKTEYGERIEDLTDLSAYPESIGDLSPDKVPISMRGLVATNPEARAMDFSPDMAKNLKLEELRDTMLEIRQSGGQYSAYGQPAVKIPPEFMLPDDTLAKLNVAAASNRVARFTGWQDEARQSMATTALRTDPRLRRDLSSDNKYISVFIPDLAKPANQELIRIVTDAGCDGGWCTRREENALGYGSGDRSLSIVLTNDGKKARPVAQISVESRGTRGYNEVHDIVDIAGKGNSYDFTNNPALPAIQEHVKNLDYIYGGLRDIAYLKNLGMIRIPRDSQQPAGVIEFGVSANMRHVENLLSSTTDAKKHNQLLKDMTLLKTLYGDKAEGLRKVVDEAVRLNEKSSLVVGNEDTMSELLQQALKNVTTPRQQAQGGFMERQSNDNRKYL